MKTKIIKNVFLSLLFIFLLTLTTISALADYKINDLGDFTYNSQKADLNSYLQSSQFSYNIEYKESIYYVSYLKEVLGFKQNFIAYSSDLSNWTTTQLTTDASDKKICHLYLDVDMDLICIKYDDSSKLKYWIMNYGSTSWSSSYTTWDESSNYNYNLGAGLTIYKIWDYIWITTANSSSIENFISFQMNFENGYYNVTFVGGGNGNQYENISSPIVHEIIFEQTDLSEFHRIFGNTIQQHAYIDGSNYKYDYQFVNNTNGWSWTYRDGAENLYSFYIHTTGSSDYLSYKKWDSSSENWGAGANIPLNNLTRLNWVDMIEGDNYIWGIYRTKPSSSPQIYSYLHRFKIAKSNMSLMEDIGLGSSLRNVSAIGNIYGLKDARWRSSNIMVTDNLIVTYSTGKNGIGGFEASPLSVLPFDLWIYYADVGDKLEDRKENLTYECVTDDDCVLKFGSNYECINFLCSVKIPSDIGFEEGDIAFDFMTFLEDDIGIKSTSSKIFFGVFLLMLINIFVTIIWLSFGAEPNLLISGMITILSVFGLAYIGLFPIWVIVSIIIITASIILLFFTKGGS